ncbi:hypothetical protein LUZ60_013676 [Juncus effusus]|nr:hypothetical protein LUZ60_013676 [Juncus effusus]
MATLEGPVLYRPVTHQKQSTKLFTNTPLAKKPFTLRGSNLWGGFSCKSKGTLGNSLKNTNNKSLSVCHSFSSSSDNGNLAGNFSESDEDYIDSSVMEAVEVKRGSEGVIIKMRDGRNLKCVYNNPQAGSLPDYAPHPAIVLKMEDGSDLLLPIIVLELPSVLLMAAVREVQLARPTVYEVLKQMTGEMGYTVKRVRVTKSVQDAYYAEIYFSNIENEMDIKVIDCRPSDAINVAVRCKVPIQVNKKIIYSDGMRVVEERKLTHNATHSDGMLFTELDRPDGQPCVETKEFGLVRNMLLAAVEERYKDAALWRDRLMKLRAKRKNWA